MKSRPTTIMLRQKTMKLADDSMSRLAMVGIIATRTHVIRTALRLLAMVDTEDLIELAQEETEDT